MQCPIDKTPLVQAGRTYKCETCDGAWVRADVLVPLLEQSASTLVALDWEKSGEVHVRACPECGEQMQTVKLGSVNLDRHEPHGVWFDKKELAELLKDAKQFRADLPPHETLMHKLRRIFDRK
ncbi:MAG TPA: zf-TFIIB domain-containing protein [Kofleriaceae bacterium]|nr:zf-TFIIB domain-containing protein [Kofleriaceae bacterium]